MELKHCVCSGKNLERFLRPMVMALLARQGTHGYDIVQQLKGLQMFACSPPDSSGVYKILKAMEREGLVVSTWNLKDSPHAKRRYVLSDKGITCLRQWVQTLEIYRDQIDEVLNVIRADNLFLPLCSTTQAQKTEER